MALTHFVLATIVLAPILSVSVPGLGDTLNHLARMHILASIDGSPELRRFYEVHWAPIPYLAMDAVVPLLMHAVPVYLAGKLFVVSCVVLPVGGAAAVHYAVHRRASLVPCAAWLVSTNALLSLGFLNFLFTTGLALLLFAGWIATAAWPRWRRAALFAPCVLALYFGHAFGCGAYCLAVLGFEGARAIRAKFQPVGVVLVDLTAAFAQAVPALVCAATLHVSAGYVGVLRTHYGTVGEKISALLTPVIFLHDAMQGGVLLGMLATAALLVRRLRVHPALGPAILVVAAVALAVPHVLASTWGTDMRLPLVAVLLLVSALSVRLPPSGRALAVAAVVMLTAVKSADAWVALHQVDAQFARTRAILAALPRGTRLLVVNPDGHGTGREHVPLSTAWNLPLVATIDRDAFIPTLFTGLTTVRVRPAYRASSTPNGLPISPAQLWEGEHTPDRGEQGDGEGARLYHFGWPEKFDYVLVQRFGADPGALPSRLHLVAHDADMDLYRIR